MPKETEEQKKDRIMKAIKEALEEYETEYDIRMDRVDLYHDMDGTILTMNINSEVDIGYVFKQEDFKK